MLKLHLDTDLGGDIDDLCALAMALNCPAVDLLAVTTNSDDQGRRAGYTRYALGLAGRSDVPVAAGADAALGCYRVWPGLPDETLYWPEPVPPAPAPLEGALTLLERSIEQGALIVAIGAFTNLALLEKRSPGILRRAKLTLMGGYVFPPREGFPTWGNDMDWNIQEDVQSAYEVIQHSNPTLVPLTITIETALRRAYLPALRAAGPLAQLIARQAEVFASEYNNEAQFGQTCAGLPNDIINFLHDPLACAIALGWRDGVEISELPLTLEIRDGWLYEKVDPAGRLTRVVTHVDGGRFNDFWINTVAGKNRGLPVAYTS
ncbi:MAG TPA: nucleoside hydrolase [Anaerolineae bacterium]